MNRIIVISLSIIILIGIGCASKRYARKGEKFEKAGLYEMATDAYLQSLAKRKDNIDAIVGLKRAGQHVVDENCTTVVKSYQVDDLKKTVYVYIKTDSLRNRASQYGVELTISDVATQCFNDAKPKYIEKQYSEAKALLDEEKFAEAENLLSEIKKLQPDFGDVQELYKISKCEPLYRQAKQYMNDALYRKAYNNLHKIIHEFNSYKDAFELRNEALQNALITIKVNNFTSFYPNTSNITTMVQGAVVGKLNNLNNPFIKLLDANNSKQIIDEQRKSDMVGGNLEIGKLLTAKAILSGEVTVLQISEGNIYKTEKKGYLREETKTKDPKTGEVKVNVSYQKTIYYTYEQENKVSIAFKFQLTSTETGAVMVSDYFLSSKSDYIEYATFNGPGEKLVPGYWEKKDSKSSNDVVYDDITNVNKLHRLLNARRQITSINSLINDAVDELAMQAVKKINYYNPEK